MLSCSGTTCIVVLFCAAIPVILAPPCAYAAMELKEIAANKNIAVAVTIVIYLFIREIEEIQVYNVTYQ
jgi:hypothetical protein